MGTPLRRLPSPPLGGRRIGDAGLRQTHGRPGARALGRRTEAGERAGGREARLLGWGETRDRAQAASAYSLPPPPPNSPPPPSPLSAWTRAASGWRRAAVAPVGRPWTGRCSWSSPRASPSFRNRERGRGTVYGGGAKQQKPSPVPPSLGGRRTGRGTSRRGSASTPIKPRARRPHRSPFALRGGGRRLDPLDVDTGQPLTRKSSLQKIQPVNLVQFRAPSRSSCM